MKRLTTPKEHLTQGLQIRSLRVLGRGRKKKHNKELPQGQNNRNQQTEPIDNCQYQKSQFPNKNTQTDRMDTKAVSIFLLLLRNASVLHV